MHSMMFKSVSANEQRAHDMATLGVAAESFYQAFEQIVPDGPDKTYALRKLREVMMWGNVAIIKNPDGSPRT